jgi:hypothetical protein
VTVDVVPYITDLVRSDSVNVTRTRLGKFSLPEDLVDLEVHGYNLDPAWARIYNDDGSASTALTPTGAASPWTEFNVTLTTNYSGYLWVDVNGVVAINNFNDNTLEQNMQDDGSGIPATLWRDDLYIELWDVDNDFNGSDDPERPAMTVRDDGLHYAAWSNYTGSDSYYGTDTADTNYYGTYDPPEWNDMAFNPDNDDLFIVHLRNYFNGVATWGELAINAFEPAPVGQETDWDIVDDLDNVLYQYRNPRIAVKAGATGTESIIYISYYDANTDELKFSSWHYANDTDTLTARTTGDNIVVDTDGDVGLYSDIAIDSAGIPFIVYYDTTNQRLKVARADDDDPDATGEWNISTVDDTISYFGEYVSVAVDTAGDVHVSAYRNSTGDLLYFTAADVASPAAFTFTTTTVDEPGAVGAWSEMATDGTTPYISYINESQAGTYFGLKYAYWTGTEWEYGTVPIGISVTSDRTGLVTKPPGAGVMTPATDFVATVGYSGTMYYFARLRPEQ